MISRTHLSYLADYESITGRSEKAAAVAGMMSRIYKLANYVCIAVFLINLPLGILILIKDRKRSYADSVQKVRFVACWIMSAVFGGIGFLYSFAIGWFSSFIHGQGIVMSFINYYNVALPVLLALSYLFALSCFYGLIKAGKNHYEKDRKNECDEAA